MRLLALSVFALAAALSAGPPAAAVAAPQADPPSGKRLFLRCASCHAIEPGGAERIGPSLAGVVGRKAGGLKGYRYSPSMVKQSFVWDDATLDRWLARPSSVVPGTSMAFAGLANPGDRAAMIAYLKKPSR